MNDVSAFTGFISGQTLLVSELALKCYHCDVAAHKVHKCFFKSCTPVSYCY